MQYRNKWSTWDDKGAGQNQRNRGSNQCPEYQINPTTEQNVTSFQGRHIFLPNVPRQQSLAGGAGGSDGLIAKALDLLFCQQALCLSGGTSNP
jgi:hypothetical protein